ncbi:pol-polyprotein [Gossypium australe]|uniref:Pol-polyprotein n=1 Tax=Gossypium australe TaxID=47621 RepID=A0A5B6X3Y2_9ROSI|nr:pol-polyprotein [Gossypium australe]
MTSQSIKDILAKADTSGRMTKWSIKLPEFGVEYTPRTTIKGEKLANFIVECSFENPISPTVYVDGSTTKTRLGVGVFLVDPSENEWKYGLSSNFPTSNNTTEYEALIA